jgi:hypothetical protein
MATTAELIESVVGTIADYREGEISPPDAAHVELWLAQFPNDQRKLLISELAHVLKQTYISRKYAVSFLKDLITNEKLAGNNPKLFWESGNFLNIQKNGNSQKELLELFTKGLKSALDVSIDECGGGNNFVYLDDVVFTGGRVGDDLEAWIRGAAPQTATVHVIVMAVHTFGSWKMQERLRKVAAAIEKRITVEVWRALSVENRMARRNQSDVLWPTSLPAEAGEYPVGKFPFSPRTPGGASEIFSGEEGRHALEQSLLEAGMKIRGLSANPKPILRPLGFSPFGVGFGSTIVTYRNCPNNAPLALWWGDPTASAGHPFSKWRPLVPRKTYGGAEIEL